VVVVVTLAEGAAPELLSVELLPPPVVEPGPPMVELVLPDVSPLAEPVVAPPMALVPPVPLLPGVVVVLEVDVSLPGAGLVTVVDELDDDVVGVPV
jgi:hypothetical protein